MAEIVPNPYDEVFYDSKSRGATHPDCLATLATLLGMQPAPVDRCRVLEIGCATGGNLLPLAEALPNSRFVGIDLSAMQIDVGRKVAAALELSNLHLEQHGILDVDESLGTFDYILCHGIYSWVSEPVRDKMLSICRNNLAPEGVAYVSYNTYPGWHLRASVREMMHYRVRGIEDARERLRQARSLLGLLVRATPAQEGVWGQILREEAELVDREADGYLFHEHLEAENHPVYFHQFIDHARRHGLQYLGEAKMHATLAGFPTEVSQALKSMSDDLLDLEQYLDFVRNRMFRRTLLVREEVVLNRTPEPAIIGPLSASAMARPIAVHPNVGSPDEVEFQNEEGVVVGTNVPLAKAALIVLFECWPQALPFEELWERVVARLQEEGIDLPSSQVRGMLSRSLVHLYLSNLAGLHVHVPLFVTTASNRPCTTPLIRLQARTGATITNRRHRQIPFTVLDRAVLDLLDGSRDRSSLVHTMTERVRRGDLELQREGQAVTEPDAVRAVLEEELEGSLLRLAQSAVLVA